MECTICIHVHVHVHVCSDYITGTRTVCLRSFFFFFHLWLDLFALMVASLWKSVLADAIGTTLVWCATNNSFKLVKTFSTPSLKIFHT